MAAALAAVAETIVTGDRDLFDDPALGAWLAERVVVLLRPTELAGRLSRA